jgi:hypothetical protein
MKKLLLTLLLLGSILPSVEAGVSPEGIPKRPRNFSPEGRLRPRKPRCKDNGKIVVCTVPRPRKKCTIRRPCVPPGYYRPTPPRYPMPTLPNPPFVIGG